MINDLPFNSHSHKARIQNNAKGILVGLACDGGKGRGNSDECSNEQELSFYEVLYYL